MEGRVCENNRPGEKFKGGCLGLKGVTSKIKSMLRGVSGGPSFRGVLSGRFKAKSQIPLPEKELPIRGGGGGQRQMAIEQGCEAGFKKGGERTTYTRKQIC